MSSTTSPLSADAAGLRPTVVVSRAVRPGGEPAFELWLQRLRSAVERAPGYVGATFSPPSEMHPGEWLVVYQFRDVTTLERWLSSPERRTLVEESGANLSSDPVEQRLVGAATGSATMVSAARLVAGSDEAHRRLHAEALVAAQRLGGLTHAEVLQPVPGVQEETVALLTFASREDLDRWLHSEERLRVLRAMEDLAAGARTVSVLGGFAGWFSPPGTAAPPRWKQATVVVLGLLPLACLVSTARATLLPGLGVPWSTVLTTVVNVAILTWGILPWLTRLLRRWLTGAPGGRTR